MDRGCPYLYNGSKFRVTWPSVLIIQGGLQQSNPPLKNMFGKKCSRELGLIKFILVNLNKIEALGSLSAVNKLTRTNKVIITDLFFGHSAFFQLVLLCKLISHGHQVCGVLSTLYILLFYQHQQLGILTVWKCSQWFPEKGLKKIIIINWLHQKKRFPS